MLSKSLPPAHPVDASDESKLQLRASIRRQSIDQARCIEVNAPIGNAKGNFKVYCDETYYFCSDKESVANLGKLLASRVPR
jgi:hypothetical protein